MTVNGFLLAATIFAPLSSSSRTKCTFCFFAAEATFLRPPPRLSMDSSFRELIVLAPLATEVIQSDVHFSAETLFFIFFKLILDLSGTKSQKHALANIKAGFSDRRHAKRTNPGRPRKA